MDNVTERLNFEKKVVIDGNTKRIDVYIPETRVIIEQKSLGKALDQKIQEMLILLHLNRQTDIMGS